MPKLTYPPAHRIDQMDNYHGTLIADPYRWMEEVDSPETLEWIRQQNELTFTFLEKIPSRAPIRERLTQLWDYAKVSSPYKKGGRYFQFRNSGLQNQDVLHVYELLTDTPRILLDPNTLSKDGTVALNSWSVSPDGKWLAYAISSSGSDWQVWYIRSVDSGQDLPETLEWSKFSGATWSKDSSGFFYAPFPAPAEGETFQEANYNQKLFFHRIGTSQAEDQLVYERPDRPEWGFGSEVSEDGHYLLIYVSQGTDSRNRFFYKDLKSNSPVVELIPDLEATYNFIGNDGSMFFFQTNLDAPRGHLITIDSSCPKPENRKTLIPENEAVLQSAQIIHDQLVIIYMKDAHDIIKLFNLDGSPAGDVSLPTLGSVMVAYESSLHGERKDSEMFYAFHSFIHPLTIFRYDFQSGQSQVIFQPPINFDLSSYETNQVLVTSKDGTRVPMFLIHRKGLQKNGDNPTILYGYGGFNLAQTPAFAIHRLVWMEMGGVLAIGNLRGGGEYGEEWHQAGMIHTKQNVFEDFIACAEWLIHEKITRTARLAIEGRSNGGLLVGACMTQRPDLFGAALPAVGVMDMLRFHKFTIGWAWVSDYGSADDPEQFKTLVAYSPLHNLKPGTHYPATLVTTADHDDRVVPGHSFKFTATLQACQAGDAPTLIRVQTRAGHGLGKPTSIWIEEYADVYAFLIKVLGM
ncbi:MAG: prolyl endopeptidase [Chloroflexi bacterium GWB2_49_20]|nr:MAG: prolyl endopeptidase [Chloroflexi bacterium GWB2_49_20]OGN76673.1 MAG: prolyl endopeptidase [Chloroflexi bacterium GWC2_49_37]OGN83633.1 MAG: prolyl endopeptidase [Chloroflexi bacterium GWD2_49_16]HBG74247.1 S9 family peptidase [Anaerolineae bacterium]HCC79453.1 S9 family peptidase [Anaerolineae bacterium]